MSVNTHLCHFVTSPPQGGRLGVFADRSNTKPAPLAVERCFRILPDEDERRSVRRRRSPPLWGRCHEVTEGGLLPHTPIPPKIRKNARAMRNVMTDAELRLWNELRAHRLMGLGFRRQLPIAGYIVDFACPAEKLIVEIDGSQHANDRDQTYDRVRTLRLQADGWTVLRFWNDDVLKDIDNVCMHILIVLGKDRA